MGDASGAVGAELIEILHPRLRVRLDDYLAVREEISIHLLPTGADAFVGTEGLPGLVTTHPTFRTILMNESAARVLALCDGRRSVAALLQSLAESSSETLPDVARLTLPFLAQATDQGILDVYPAPRPTDVHVTGSPDFCVPLHVLVELAPVSDASRDVGHTSDHREEVHEPVDLTTDQWLSVLNRLRDGGVRVLELAAGGPVARRDFFTLWDFCVGHFSLVALLTDGRLVDESVGERLADHAGQVIVQVDLDGCTAESHDRLHGPGAYARAVRAIQTLVTKGVATRVGMRVDGRSIHEVEDTRRLAKDLGAQWFVPSPVLDVDWGDDRDAVRLQLNEFIQRNRAIGFVVNEHGDFVPCLARDSLRFRGTASNCGAGYRSVVVGPTGRVRPCPLIGEEAVPCRSLNDGDLQAVFDQPFTSHMNNLPSPGPETCAGCPLVSYCSGCHVKAIYVQRLAGKMGLACAWAGKSDLRSWVDFDAVSRSRGRLGFPACHGFALL